jgi:hypothetical protein
VSSPNAACASRFAASIAPFNASGERTIRIPFPPPPADAFTSSGNPTSAASPSGSTGTPASRISRFASTFEPIFPIAAGDGPTHDSPASCTAHAKLAFSARNP